MTSDPNVFTSAGNQVVGECPVCGSALPAPAATGRPRRYCSSGCRYTARHQADAERRRQREGEWWAQTYEDLMAQDFSEYEV